VSQALKRADESPAQQTPQAPPRQSWLKLAEVATRFQVRRQTVRAWVAASKFPRPITLPGGRQVRWDSREIERVEREWLKARPEAA
jgi:predicted DNA-binding transcriptional regulator AlpA